MADVYFFGRAAKKNFSDDRVFAGRDIATYSTPTHAHDHTHAPTHPHPRTHTHCGILYTSIHPTHARHGPHTHTHMGHTWATHAASIYMYAAIEPSISTSIDRHRFPLWVFSSIRLFVQLEERLVQIQAIFVRSNKARARSHQTTLPIDIDIDIDGSIDRYRYRWLDRGTL